MPSGLADLDRKLGGLHKSDLVILAARPSMGKTALATNIAYFGQFSLAEFRLEDTPLGYAAVIVPVIGALIIGEVLATNPDDVNQRKILQASARASRVTGAAISIFGGRGTQLKALDVLTSAGADPSRSRWQVFKNREGPKASSSKASRAARSPGASSRIANGTKATRACGATRGAWT